MTVVPIFFFCKPIESHKCNSGDLTVCCNKNLRDFSTTKTLIRAKLQMIDDLLVSELNQHSFFAHINIKSIHKNFNTVNDQFLLQLQYLPDIICLSEAKVKNDKNDSIWCNLPEVEPVLHATVTATNELSLFALRRYLVANLFRIEIRHQIYSRCYLSSSRWWCEQFYFCID